jgi:hypothetical protein
VLIAALTSGFIDRVERNPDVPPAVRAQIGELAQEGIPVVPVDDIEQAARDAGLPPGQATALAGDYGEAQLDGLRRAIGAIGIFALISLWFTRRLPERSLQIP